MEMNVLYKRESNDSILRMAGGAWFINFERVDMETIDEFIYTTEDFQYKITREEALQHGFEMMLGGERKWVVSLKYWDVSPLSL